MAEKGDGIDTVHHQEDDMHVSLTPEYLPVSSFRALCLTTGETEGV